MSTERNLITGQYNSWYFWIQYMYSTLTVLSKSLVIQILIFRKLMIRLICYLWMSYHCTCSWKHESSSLVRSWLNRLFSFWYLTWWSIPQYIPYPWFYWTIKCPLFWLTGNFAFICPIALFRGTTEVKGMMALSLPLEDENISVSYQKITNIEVWGVGIKL